MSSLDPIVGLSGLLILKQLISRSLLGHVVDSNLTYTIASISFIIANKLQLLL